MKRAAVSAILKNIFVFRRIRESMNDTMQIMITMIIYMLIVIGIGLAFAR